MQYIRAFVPEDVFSRSEPLGRQFLLRPRGGKPPHALLLEPPAADLWHELRRSGPGQPIEIDQASATVLALLGRLVQDDFVRLDGGMPAGVQADAAPPEALGLRDPWDYQFAMPTLASPWFALWEITDDCPLQTACHFCYRPKEVSGGPSSVQAERVCEQLERSEIPWVTLLGGEPLVYPRLYPVIERLRASRIFVNVITNGVLVTRPAALALARSGVNQVAVSLDGLDATTHDLNRGEGAFAKSLQAIRVLQEHVPLVSISLTVTNQVFEQLDRLTEFCAGLGVPEVYISPLRLTENTRVPSPDVGPMRPEQQSLLADKVATFNGPDLTVISLRECSCGRSSIVVHTDGEVSACPFAVRHYGSVYEEDLASIWERITPIARRIGTLVPGAYCFRRHELEAHRQHGLELVDG